jgi:hypothetical protein
MAIIVVGGGGRGAGKTALICGIVRALPEISWTAIKITSHAHVKPTPIWQETVAGDESDTARYLAAGARRALLVTASEDALGPGDDTLGPIVEQVLRECPPPAGAIFESNSVLRCLRPDLCLAAASSLKGEHKPSYELVQQRMDAMVELAGHDHIIDVEEITFRLASMERVSPTMQEWLRERLGERQGIGSSQ